MRGISLVKGGIQGLHYPDWLSTEEAFWGPGIDLLISFYIYTDSAMIPRSFVA